VIKSHHGIVSGLILTHDQTTKTMVTFVPTVITKYETSQRSSRTTNHYTTSKRSLIITKVSKTKKIYAEEFEERDAEERSVCARC
jgi:hypothetical protein